MKQLGYIKLHRKLVEHPIYDDPTAAFLFITLLLLVDRESGSYDGGRFVLAKKIGVKPITCYKALKRLERYTMVKLTVNAKYTKITVVNWHVWQSSVNARETQSNTKQEGRINISTNVDMSITNQSTPRNLFSELVQILGFSDKVLFTEQRGTKLKQRLKTFSVEQIKQAATAIAEDDFLQGDNKAGKRYGDIDFLLRSDEQLDKYLQASVKKKTVRADW